MSTFATERARSPYTAPALDELGFVTRLTMGNGGSSLDGNCTMTQRGGGNNGQNDGGPDSCTNGGNGLGNGNGRNR